MSCFMRTAWRGSCNIVHAATAPGLENGVFYRECEIMEDTAKLDEMWERGDGKRLWELSEECLKSIN